MTNQLEHALDAGSNNNADVRAYTKMETKAIELGIQYDTTA